MVLVLGDDLGAESGGRALSQVLVVLLVDVDFGGDLLNLRYRNLAGLVESIRNFQRVDALVKELLGLVEDGSCQDDNTSSAITDFIILTSRELGKKFRGLMVDLKIHRNVN